MQTIKLATRTLYTHHVNRNLTLWRPLSSIQPKHVRWFASSSKSKTKVVFECMNCGKQMLQWAGQCPNCGGWDIEEQKLDALVRAPKATRRQHELAFENGKDVGGETPVSTGAWVGNGGIQGSSAPQALGTIPHKLAMDERVPFPDLELNRIFGGGLVNGSCTLLAGLPGVGKSTLGLQLAAMISDMTEEHKNVLYVACEESINQVRMRASRLGTENPGVDSVLVVNEPNLDVVLEHATSLHSQKGSDGSPGIGAIVVDSIQTVYDEMETGQAGSIVQVRSSTLRLNHFAKATGVPVLLISHVNKSGDVSGPRVLEHIVDAVFMLEPFDNDHENDGKVWMRATKNRFAQLEVGLFSMTSSGFSSKVAAGTAFVSIPLQVGRSVDGASLPVDRAMPQGSALVVTMEGTQSTQPVLVEVQALGDKVAHSSLPPQHRANGITVDRMRKVLAVLSKHASLGSVRSSDILINVVGGIKLAETGSDLGMAMAIASTITGHNVISEPWPEERLVDSRGTIGRKQTRRKVRSKKPHASGNSFGCAFIGEIGLGGEIRPVKRMAKRLELALKYNIAVVMVPVEQSSLDSVLQEEKLVNAVGEVVQVIRVSNILEALDLGLED